MNTPLAPTGVDELDAALGGGLPRGQLSEIVGARSSGRSSLLLQHVAAATRRGELVAVVDALDMLDVASLAAAGVVLDRLLWIRGHVVINPGMCRDLNQRAMEQALRALALVLQAGNFGLVVLDVGEAPVDAHPAAVHDLAAAAAHGRRQSDSGVLVGSTPMARSSAGLTIKLEAGRWTGGTLFTGFDIEGQIVRARARGQEDTRARFATKGHVHV